MKKTQILGALAMAAIVVISNILVQYPVMNWLTMGAFTYPFAFLVTDLMNRLEGPQAARRIVLVGFVIGLICSLIGSQIIGEFGPLVTLRIALASGLAFLTAQMLDVGIFDRLRKNAWWQPPVFSSVIGSTIDTMIFFFVAFSAQLIWLEPGNDVSWANEVLPILGVGPQAPLWVSLAIADYFVKLVIALIALVPYRQTIKSIEAHA